jgi:hypothetical protein
MADDLAGKKVRCAGCEAVVTAPNTSEAIEADDRPAMAKTSSTGVKAGTGPANGRDDEDRPRRRSGSDATTAVAAAGAGIGIGAIIAIVCAVGGVLACCGVGVVGVALLFPAVQRVRDAAGRVETMNNMKQIALAEINHQDAMRTFPPPKVMNPQNQPVDLSWRVSILPYIEEHARFQRFSQSVAWDNPANQPLLNPLPKVYHDTRLDGPNQGAGTTTRFQYFTGPGTMWPDAKTTKITIMQITAGTSNTILFAESANPVPWTKPADMTIQPGQALPVPQDQFIAAFADGSVRQLDRRRHNDAAIREHLDPKNNKAVPPLD